MRRLVIGLLLMVIACGQPQAEPATSPVALAPNPSANVPKSSPVASASPTAKTIPPPQPSASNSLLFAALEAKGTANSYTWNTVALVGLDGYAKAKTTFIPMSVPVVGCMGAIIPESATVAAGKVYFADGKGVVRSLSASGQITKVATFPLTSSQQMLSFAVSPDGSRLLGTVFTVPKNAFPCNGSSSSGTFTFDAYAAASGEAGKLLYHQTWTTPPSLVSLIGWDSLGPIGTYPTVWASQGGGPGSTLGVRVRIDARTLKVVSQFADPSKCLVWQSTLSGAFVCVDERVLNTAGNYEQTLRVRQADGREMWHFTAGLGPIDVDDPRYEADVFNPLLAPDEQHVVLCCADVAGAYGVTLAARDGGQVILGQNFYADGWLDSTTVFGSTSSPPYPVSYVRLSAPNKVVSMGFSGKVVGTVRP
jgi:outer membrane protein assembly factor BamB